MRKYLSLDIKYSLIQALYFSSIAGIMGFASVYLLDKGFSNSVIGLTLALVSIISVFAQPMVASFADKNKNIELKTIIEIIVLAGTILSALIYFLKGQSVILLCVFVGIATCLQTIQPLTNSLAFLFEKYGIEVNFGLARGMGSAAYALVSFVLGYVVKGLGANVLPIVYLIFNILLIAVVHVFVIPNEEKQEVVLEEKKEEKQQLSFVNFCIKYKKFMIFVFGIIVVFFTHTIINNFLIQIIRPIGGTESQMGTAVFLAAIVEVPAMTLFNVIRQKVSCGQLLKIAGMIFALKHVMTFFAPNMMVIYIAQLLQIGSFAIFVPASVYYVNQSISTEDAIKGQSMVTMGMTASGILANLLGGILLDAIGVHYVLLIGAIASVIGVFIISFSVETEKS